MAQACRECKRIVTTKQCPVCKTTNLTNNFQGIVVIFSIDSEIGKKLGITAPGKYALKV
jgi:DNA-directed RNA polymerase subunit E"